MVPSGMATYVTLSRGSSTPWHPKLTGFRLLVIFLTVGLGTAKAITTLHGQIWTSVTLEWMIGVAVSLASVGFLKSIEIVLILSTYSIYILETYKDDSLQGGQMSWLTIPRLCGGF